MASDTRLSVRMGSRMRCRGRAAIRASAYRWCPSATAWDNGWQNSKSQSRVGAVSSVRAARDVAQTMWLWSPSVTPVGVWTAGSG